MTNPESEMMKKGWDPADGLDALKPPLFQTSTFVFESAAAAERLFDIVYGGKEPEAGEGVGFIYTRMDHPTWSSSRVGWRSGTAPSRRSSSPAGPRRSSPPSSPMSILVT